MGGRGGAGRNHRYGVAQRPEAPVALLKNLTSFDPNALSAIDWQRRGVPADVARRLVSYGRKAGGFRYREQIARINGLDEALAARLTPLMQLPTRDELYQRPGGSAARPAYAATPSDQAPGGAPQTVASSGFTRKPRVIQRFDLNTADTLTLMQLRGIGQRRAARIIELREKLGGFVSAAQLADVWGLEPALIDSLAKYGHIAADFHPRPLALNSASLDELKQHPYVGPRLARVITAFRDQHGPFAKPEDLRQIRILEEATYQKLQPYLAMR